MDLWVNGQRHDVNLRPDETLLEALRDRLGLTTVRETCSVGVCGACTVLIDGRAVSSCLTLAQILPGTHVQTLEGLTVASVRIQRQILAHEALQCGWCTPGFIVTVEAMRRERPAGTWTHAEVEDHLSGNLCRCTGYLRLVEATLAVLNGDG